MGQSVLCSRSVLGRGDSLESCGHRGMFVGRGWVSDQIRFGVGAPDCFVLILEEVIILIELVEELDADLRVVVGE